MYKYKKGDKVICISNDHHPSFLLKVGKIYSINSIERTVGSPVYYSICDEPDSYAEPDLVLAIGKELSKLEKIIYNIKIK